MSTTNTEPTSSRDTSNYRSLGLRFMAALALLSAAFFVPGCTATIRPAHHHRGHHHDGAVVKVKAGHVHNSRCGHYQHRGKWYLKKGHVHGKKCGHVLVRGVWVLR